MYGFVSTALTPRASRSAWRLSALAPTATPCKYGNSRKMPSLSVRIHGGDVSHAVSRIHEKCHAANGSAGDDELLIGRQLAQGTTETLPEIDDWDYAAVQIENAQHDSRTLWATG